MIRDYLSTFTTLLTCLYFYAYDSRFKLTGTLKREEALKQDIVAANLRWEQRWSARESESSAAHDALVKALQQQRDRLSVENKASEQRITQLENDCSTLRIHLQEARAQMRLLDARTNAQNGKKAPKSFNDFARESDDLNYLMSASSGGGHQSNTPSSPIFSEDMGPASPLSSLGFLSTPLMNSANPSSFPAPSPLLNTSASPSKFSKLRDENQYLRSMH